ncbi:MAG: hypothetical protein HY865_09525 [Chloroflexi bacterium]|nr:hypothetical protein [Chloroflexota bacterium]
MNLERIVKSLGLPLGVVAVIVSILALVGLDAEQIAKTAVTLVGAQACVLLVIDILKWSGVVSDGTAGKWSAVFNAAIFVALIVQTKFFPLYDVLRLDAQLLEFAKTAGVVFLYVAQVAGTKAIRELVRRLGIKVYTFSNASPPTASMR